MFKFFSQSDDLLNAFIYINSFENVPKVIISDMNFLSNYNKSNYINNIINNSYTIDFFIIDTKNIRNIQDNLQNFIDPIYSQDVVNSSFFLYNTVPIDKVNNIISVLNPNNLNSFIYNLINDDFYKKSFDTKITFFLLFSSLPLFISFLCKYNTFNNIYFILKPNEKYDDNKIKALQEFVNILLK
jgi:hypothetical protein